MKLNGIEYHFQKHQQMKTMKRIFQQKILSLFNINLLDTVVLLM